MHTKQLDPLGRCPNCKQSWKGSDIKEELSDLDVFSDSSNKELEKVAGFLGWLPENKKTYSTCMTIQKNNSTFIKCSNIRCGKIFNIPTGMEVDHNYSPMVSNVSEW